MMRIIKSILLYILVFSVTILVIDRFIKYAEISSVSLYEYNSRIGRVLRPETDFLFFNEGLGMGSINEFGYIGKGYSEQKNDTIIRVALLGDSYVEAFQLFDNQYFGRVMEETLKEKYGLNVEVLNFGRSGYDLADMYAYYRNYVSKFKPDLVLYFISNEDLTQKGNEYGMPYPYLENDSLKIFYYNLPSESSRFLSIRKFSSIFPTFQLIRNCINLYKKGETMDILFDKLHHAFNKSPIPPDPKTYLAGDVQIKIIEELSKERNAVIVDRDKFGLNTENLLLIQSTGMPVIEIDDTLHILEEKGINPFYWKSIKKEGHWNHNAHYSIGIFLANKIQALIKKK